MKLSGNNQIIIAKSIIITFLLLFPFGQLLRMELNFFGKSVTLLAIDIVALLSIIFLKSAKKPKITKYINAFLAICIFSLLLSFNYFDGTKVYLGSLYLLRLFAYYSFFVLVWNLVKRNKVFKERLVAIFIISLVLTAIFGWIQYFLFFDLTFLKIAGWDDHLGRLVGTYLDPTFTGLILLLGLFMAFLKYLDKKRKTYLILSVFFLISILFSYSRASYLALLVGLMACFYFKKKVLPVVLILAIFLLSIPFLPRPQSEGVKLERTKSVVSRFGNYGETMQIINENPLFGVGFNNICWVREIKYSDDFDSHSCSGSDSSILLVFATSGVVGLLIFLYLLNTIYSNTGDDYYGQLTKIFLIIVLVHSLFSNSLFYPWVIGAGALLLGLSSKE